MDSGISAQASKASYTTIASPYVARLASTDAQRAVSITLGSGGGGLLGGAGGGGGGGGDSIKASSSADMTIDMGSDSYTMPTPATVPNVNNNTLLLVAGAVVIVLILLRKML